MKKVEDSINKLVDLINETEWYKPIAIILLIILSPVIAIVQFVIRFVVGTVEEMGNFFEDLKETKNERQRKTNQ